MDATAMAKAAAVNWKQRRGRECNNNKTVAKSKSTSKSTSKRRGFFESFGGGIIDL